MGSMFTVSCFQIWCISTKQCQLSVDSGVGGGLLVTSAPFTSAEGNNDSLLRPMSELHCFALQRARPRNPSAPTEAAAFTESLICTTHGS